MARDMTPEEYRRFMMEGTRTGKVATVRADGRPHVAPVWFVLDGDDLLFTTWHTTVKAANLRHDPHVAISVDDQTPPFSFALVEGEAKIIEDAPRELLKWATAIGARYMGADQAEAFGKRNGVPGELLIRVHPTKIITRMNMTE